ncbi:MAG: hypothetical protein MJ168_07185 [Clostridia bacterium]|nr:hypothetical protein [Clostridia bacterium]
MKNKYIKNALLVILSVLLAFLSFFSFVLIKTDNYIYSADKNHDARSVVEHHTDFNNFCASVEKKNDASNKKLMSVIESQKFSAENKFAGTLDLLFNCTKKNYINTYYADGNGGIDIYIANGKIIMVRDGYNPKCKFQTGHYSMEVYKSDDTVSETSSDFQYDDQNEYYCDNYHELSAFYHLEVAWYIAVIVLCVIIFVLIKLGIMAYRKVDRII